jgi:hypothetical protein
MRDRIDARYRAGMSEPKPDERDPAVRDPAPSEPEGEERASTPFDHPFFLPVLLIGFTLWFGYDGWLNADFDPQWIPFNRWGFLVLAVLSAWFTFQAVRERRDK